MKHIVAFMTVAMLAACGAESEPAENLATNQLEAGEDVVWNALENSSAETNVSSVELNSQGETAAREATPTPDTRETRAPAARQPAAAPKAAPTPRPKSSDQVTPSPTPPRTTTPSTTPEPATPKTGCTPEHEAMGHCRL